MRRSMQTTYALPSSLQAVSPHAPPESAATRARRWGSPTQGFRGRPTLAVFQAFPLLVCIFAFGDSSNSASRPGNAAAFRESLEDAALVVRSARLARSATARMDVRRMRCNPPNTWRGCWRRSARSRAVKPIRRRWAGHRAGLLASVGPSRRSSHPLRRSHTGPAVRFIGDHQRCCGGG